MKTEKELKELVSKILQLYAFSQARSSVNLSEICQMKMNKAGASNDLVFFHYKMVDHSSIKNSRQISSQHFKIYYENILKEIKR